MWALAPGGRPVGCVLKHLDSAAAMTVGEAKGYRMQSRLDRVLVLERAADASIGLETMLMSAGYETRAAADHLTSLRIVDEWRPAAVVVDLPGAGSAGLSARRGTGTGTGVGSVPLILVGAISNLLKATPVGAGGAGSDAPVDHDLLVAAVSRALRREKVAP